MPTLDAGLASSRRLARLCTVVLLAALAAPPVSAQSRPVLFIEGFRTTDSVTRVVAAGLRLGMAQLAESRRWPIHVMTTAEIDAFRDAGAPDDFGRPWSWGDVREAATGYRAHAVVDLTVVQQPDGVRIEVSRLTPAPPWTVVRMPDVQAPTVAQALGLLVARLAGDSTITQGR